MQTFARNCSQERFFWTVCGSRVEVAARLTGDSCAVVCPSSCFRGCVTDVSEKRADNEHRTAWRVQSNTDENSSYSEERRRLKRTRSQFPGISNLQTSRAMWSFLLPSLLGFSKVYAPMDMRAQGPI